jgi:hypothetical protein
MGDNGGIESKDENKKEEVKTEEQLKQERNERFAKDPETFIEISELVCAVIRNPKSQLGISVMVGNCKRSELNQAESELVHILRKTRISMDIQSEMIHQSKIQPAKGGMLDFVRRRK